MSDYFAIVDANDALFAVGRRFGDEWAVTAKSYSPAIITSSSMDDGISFAMKCLGEYYEVSTFHLFVDRKEKDLSTYV